MFGGNEGVLIATIISYFFIFNILTMGLNIQYGYTGIPDFTYITFLALGAYFTGAIGLPKAGTGLAIGQHYILGLEWPFPLTIICGCIAAGLFGLILGLIGLGRLRSDYFALVTFALGFVVYDVISNDVGLFNGPDGIQGVAAPLSGVLQLDSNSYQYFFILIAAIFMVLGWLVMVRIYRSPLGRTLRAIREDQDAAEALGKNTFKFRLVALVVGSMFAGVAGGLTVELVTAFDPSGWNAPETFVVWTALLVGGRANSWGVILGSLLVPTILFQGITLFVPYPAADAALVSSLEIMVIGVLLIAFMWFRPDGALPEKRRRFEDQFSSDLDTEQLESL